MIGNRIPRLLLLAVALGIAVSGVMLSVFYGQYRWLADQIVDASSAEFNQLIVCRAHQSGCDLDPGVFHVGHRLLRVLDQVVDHLAQTHRICLDTGFPRFEPGLAHYRRAGSANLDSNF